MRFRLIVSGLTAAIALSSAAALAAPLAPRTQALMERATAWDPGSVVAIGHVRTGVTPLESAGNILAVYLDHSGPLTLRVSLVAPRGIVDRRDWFDEEGVRVIALIDQGAGGRGTLPAPLGGAAPFAWDRMVSLEGGSMLGFTTLDAALKPTA